VDPKTKEEIRNLKEELRYFSIYLLYMKENLKQAQRQKQRHKILFLQIIPKRKNHKEDQGESKDLLTSKWLDQEKFKLLTIVVEFRQPKIPTIFKQQALIDLMTQATTMKQIWEVSSMIQILKLSKCTSRWKNKEWRKRIINKFNKIMIHNNMAPLIQHQTDNPEDKKWKLSFSIQM
jgi:hypothetical protein